jgi:hypothetical protein
VLLREVNKDLVWVEVSTIEVLVLPFLELPRKPSEAAVDLGRVEPVYGLDLHVLDIFGGKVKAKIP